MYVNLTRANYLRLTSAGPTSSIYDSSTSQVTELEGSAGNTLVADGHNVLAHLLILYCMCGLNCPNNFGAHYITFKTKA